jgi:hypothetical protein
MRRWQMAKISPCCLTKTTVYTSDGTDAGVEWHKCQCGQTYHPCETYDESSYRAGVKAERERIKNTTATWSPDFPTEPGWYWFYGKYSVYCADRPSKMSFVRVYTTGPGWWVYSIDGREFPKTDRPAGIWYKAGPPELPKEAVR